MFPLSKHAQLLLRKANVGPPPGHGQQHFGMLLGGGSARNGSHSSPVVFAIGSKRKHGKQELRQRQTPRRKSLARKCTF